MKKTISKLQKEATQAPKYVLKMDGLDLYISNKQPLIGCDITEDINKAMQFSVGFDNEDTKSGIYTAIAQRMTNNKDVKFEVVYLTPPKFTPEQAAKMFGVSVERIKEQYAYNAEGLEQMHKKAVSTGKKVNGYTADQLEKMTAEYYKKAI